jgi:hypothetical protein
VEEIREYKILKATMIGFDETETVKKGKTFVRIEFEDMPDHIQFFTRYFPNPCILLEAFKNNYASGDYFSVKDDSLDIYSLIWQKSIICFNWFTNKADLSVFLDSSNPLKQGDLYMENGKFMRSVLNFMEIFSDMRKNLQSIIIQNEYRDNDCLSVEIPEEFYSYINRQVDEFYGGRTCLPKKTMQQMALVVPLMVALHMEYAKKNGCMDYPDSPQEMLKILWDENRKSA